MSMNFRVRTIPIVFRPMWASSLATIRDLTCLNIAAHPLLGGLVGMLYGTVLMYVRLSILIKTTSDQPVQSAGLSIEGTVVQFHVPPFRNLGNVVHPTFACVFLSGVFAR